MCLFYAAEALVRCPLLGHRHTTGTTNEYSTGLTACSVAMIHGESNKGLASPRMTTTICGCRCAVWASGKELHGSGESYGGLALPLVYFGVLARSAQAQQS